MWVAGCSTGEEVYSLAMVLLDYLQDVPAVHPIQIFGSDVSEKAIERARGGTFPDSAMRDVSEERRKRYFIKVEGGYRINKLVRDLCVFVRHDLARDPPFSKVDLVSCRNVLIYFDQALQKRVIPTFHYCLKQPGFLLLGRSEAISGLNQLFSSIDKVHKIFARSAVPSLLSFAPRTEAPSVAEPGKVSDAPGRPSAIVDVGKQLDRLMLARYAPPGVLITEKLDVLQFRGHTGAYLQPAPGEPQNNLMKMARPGLLAPLRAAIAEVKKEMAPIRKPAEINQDGRDPPVRRGGGPLHGAAPDQATPVSGAVRGLVAASVPGEGGAGRARPRPRRPRGSRSRSGKQLSPPVEKQEGRLLKLEQELTATQEYLQSLIEEHGQTNDDLGLGQ